MSKNKIISSGLKQSQLEILDFERQCCVCGVNECKDNRGVYDSEYKKILRWREMDGWDVCPVCWRNRYAEMAKIIAGELLPVWEREEEGNKRIL